MEKNYLNTKSRHTTNGNKYKKNEDEYINNFSMNYSTAKPSSYYPIEYNYGKGYRPKNYQFNGTHSNRYRKKFNTGNYYRPNFTKPLAPNNCRNTPVLYDYSQLPNIVLANIYSHLNLKDRLSASLVCKTWRLGLFNPSLWQDSNITIYLLNRFVDLKSSDFKLQNLLKYSKNLIVKYDPNEMSLYNYLINVIIGNLKEYKNVSSVSLQPILYNLFYEDGYFYDDEEELNDNDDYLSENNAILFKNLTEWCLNTKNVEHLSLGLIDDMNKSKVNLAKLMAALGDKHANNLKSLHLSTSKKISSLALQTTNGNIQANYYDDKKFFLSQCLSRFKALTHLSIDFEHLSDDFLRSSCCLQSLKKLNLNVNGINNILNNDNRIKDESWSILTNNNKNLRVTINFIQVEESARKFNLVLNQFIPLEALRMYFCKSLNPDILQFISNNYSETLKSLIIVDAINDPSLRYHNPLRHDADPDPLVLLCWKCKYLDELVLVGYEILEINLIAIAKLRDNLKTFYVAMDCIIDLKYGKFKNNDFIEDEDGEDTIVDYGFCSEQSIRKVCKILRCDNWHPLEKDELPMCVYNYDMPYEEAYLEKILSDQNYI
ncbi:unnamed protein product [Brachionus calyciflorus]|uniref:F-box domain-containing protein n=1 Tax=Brachionus calyciflorus TaxID=104777 RepID=A0A813M1C4_9BILA|nr:unnamed protein product [Brachionus calyciflorus]